MLQFFRKYQKFFFFIVTFFVVITFSFFGTFNKTQMGARSVSEKVIGKAIDGSKVTDRDLFAIAKLVAGETKKSGLPNLLHADLVQKIFLETGTAAQLAKAYFPSMKGDLEERLAKMRAFKPYVHPEAPVISAAHIWKTFSPDLARHFEEAQNGGKEVGEKTFDLFVKLYLESRSVPHEFVKKMLGFQQQQYASFVRPDPLFEQRTFSIFGFESLSDWFGETFVHILSQTINNIALLAKERGYQVSLEEAKVDLLSNAQEGIKRFFDPHVTTEQVQNYFLQELYALGLEEKKACRAWQKVLLCKRYFDEVGGAVFVDPLMGEELQKFAQKSAEVETYQLPSELHLANFNDFLYFQAYLEQVAPKYASSLDLPHSFDPLASIEKRCPELVQKRVYLEVSEASSSDLAMQISLKETWGWEVQDENWNSLVQEFPILAKDGEKSALLDALDEQTRFKVDQFAREQIVSTRPEVITEALASATPQKKWVSFRSGGKSKLPFTGISDANALLALLEKQDTLERYTQDKSHYFTFHVLERAKEKELLTFSEAKREEAFKKIVEKNLETAYTAAREQNPTLFKTKEGGWKPFKEVKNQTGALVHASLLRKLEKEAGEGVKKFSFEFYANHRFKPFMDQAKGAIAKNPQDSKWAEGNQPWPLVRTKTSISRKESGSQGLEELFTLPDGGWSEVKVKEGGDATFYHVLSRRAPPEEKSPKLEGAQRLLADEARRVAMEDLLALFKEKNAVFIPK